MPHSSRVGENYRRVLTDGVDFNMQKAVAMN